MQRVFVARLNSTDNGTLRVDGRLEPPGTRPVTILDLNDSPWLFPAPKPSPGALRPLA